MLENRSVVRERAAFADRQEQRERETAGRKETGP